MNFELKQEHKLIQKTARDFAKNELLPEVLYRDENKIWPKEAIKKMAELELNDLKSQFEKNEKKRFENCCFQLVCRGGF